MVPKPEVEPECAPALLFAWRLQVLLWPFPSCFGDHRSFRFLRFSPECRLAVYLAAALRGAGMFLRGELHIHRSVTLKYLPLTTVCAARRTSQPSPHRAGMAEKGLRMIGASTTMRAGKWRSPSWRTPTFPIRSSSPIWQCRRTIHRDTVEVRFRLWYGAVAVGAGPLSCALASKSFAAPDT